MYAHEIPRPTTPDAVSNFARKELQSQGYYVANELTRRWCERFGDASLCNVSSVHELSRKELFDMASWFARRTGLARDQVLKLFITGKLPKLPTLLRLAKALGNSIRLNFFRLAGTNGALRYTVLLTEVVDIPVNIAALLQNMNGTSEGSDLHLLAGVTKGTLHAAQLGTRTCEFSTLFHATVARGYQLKVRFE